MTKRMEKIFNYIIEVYEKTGKTPSRKDIAERFEISHTAAKTHINKCFMYIEQGEELLPQKINTITPNKYELYDYFAGIAMGKLIELLFFKNGFSGDPWAYEEDNKTLASLSYGIAKAMLKKREEEPSVTALG